MQWSMGRQGGQIKFSFHFVLAEVDAGHVEHRMGPKKILRD